LIDFRELEISETSKTKQVRRFIGRTAVKIYKSAFGMLFGSFTHESWRVMATCTFFTWVRVSSLVVGKVYAWGLTRVERYANEFQVDVPASAQPPLG